MSSIAMLPCPFCGSDQRLSVFTDASGHRSKVICRCGVEGATASISISDVRDMLEEQAILLWNTRAEETTDEQEG